MFFILCTKATDLCETAFRELARHNLALCLTEEGSVNTLNTLESLQSQVLSIPTSKMASIANEMPVKSPLALSIDKMTSRRDDLLELLQTRQDGVAFVHQRHNLLKEKIKEVSHYVCGSSFLLLNKSRSGFRDSYYVTCILCTECCVQYWQTSFIRESGVCKFRYYD